MLQINPKLFFGFAGQTTVIDDDSIDGKTIGCIFEDPFMQVDNFGVAVGMSAPSVLVDESDIAGIDTANRSLRVNSTDYIIQPAPESEGTGTVGTTDFTRLVLKEA